MKSNIFKITVLLLIVTGSSFSCNNTKIEHKEPDPTGLKGTKWKLTGIVDTQTGILQELQPINCEECYMITFDTDYKAHGLSISNKVYLTGLNPVEIHCGTMIWECPDGDECGIYCDVLTLIKTYTFNENELKLFFNDNSKYLLYKLILQ